MKLSALPFLLLAFPFASSAQPSQPAAPAPVSAPASVTLPPDLDRVLRDYEKAWVANDPAAIAALFAPDGYALPNGAMPARGADPIRAVYAHSAGSPLSLRAFAYSQSGDLAYVLGGFAPGAGKPDFGKFVLVLTRGGDGRWLIVADMDNINQRPKKVAPGGAQ